MYLGWIICILAVLYIFALRGRRGHKNLPEIRKWRYAHRGLHGNGIPENSMAAFREALDGGYGVELDVHLLKDGNLAVIHDSLLIRTTGAEGRIEDLTTEELTQYHLEGTNQTIPSFQEVLDLFAGKAPLVVELKAERGNHAALTEKACQMMDTYPGAYCIESFDPRCVLWLKKNRPDVMRGQLTENFFSKQSKGKIHWVLKFIMTQQLGNFLTLPDFVAYRFADRRNLGNLIVRKIWRVHGVTWTVRSPEDHDVAEKEGWTTIFEGFRP